MVWTITPRQVTNWDPSYTTTALWLDAGMGSTLFDSNTGGSQSVNGGVVGRWEDRSGNGRHVTQSTNANRPLLVANGLNNTNVVDFDGSNDKLISAATLGDLLTNARATSWFAVAIAETIDTNFSTGAAYQNEAILGDSQAYFALTLRNNTTNGFLVQAYDTGERNASVAYSANNWAIFEGSLGGGLLRARLNGGTEATTAFGINSRLTGVFQVGAQWTGSTNYLDGKVAEVIVYKDYAPVDIRQKTEGYLAHKWGLTANLPGDHPFKINPPAP